MKDRGTRQGSRDHLQTVQGKLTFAARRSSDDELPSGTSFAEVTHDVTIRDARPIRNELSLDREGFALVNHQTKYAEERNADVIRDHYLPELVPFIQELFGASWVVPNAGFSSFVRHSRLPIIEGTERTVVAGIKRPARVVHIDYAPIAAPMLAALQSQLAGIPIRSYSRLIVINTWRAVSPPPQDAPLALCDSATISEADLFFHDYTQPESGVRYKAASPHYSPLQRWYYFSDMTPGEVILFKTFDSAKDYWVPHGTFDNRAACPSANPRASLEGRFFVYYE